MGYVPLFSYGIPQERTVQRTSSNFLARNNGPNEALECVQAYIDALTVITRVGAALENVSARKQKKVLVPRTQQK